MWIWLYKRHPVDFVVSSCLKQLIQICSSYGLQFDIKFHKKGRWLSVRLSDHLGESLINTNSLNHWSSHHSSSAEVLNERKQKLILQYAKTHHVSFNPFTYWKLYLPDWCPGHAVTQTGQQREEVNTWWRTSHQLECVSGSGGASGLPPPAPFLTFCHTLRDISHPVHNPITPRHV